MERCFVGSCRNDLRTGREVSVILHARYIFMACSWLCAFSRSHSRLIGMPRDWKYFSEASMQFWGSILNYLFLNIHMQVWHGSIYFIIYVKVIEWLLQVLSEPFHYSSQYPQLVYIYHGFWYETGLFICKSQIGEKKACIRFENVPMNGTAAFFSLSSFAIASLIFLKFLRGEQKSTRLWYKLYSCSAKDLQTSFSLPSCGLCSPSVIAIVELKLHKSKHF